MLSSRLAPALLLAIAAGVCVSDAWAMGRGKPKDKELRPLAGVYATTYTGPDLLDEAAVLRVCPRRVVLELLNGVRRLATPEDSEAINAALQKGRVRHVRLQLQAHAAAEPVFDLPPVTDPDAPGGARAPLFRYDSVARIEKTKAGHALRIDIQGLIEPSTPVQISTLYRSAGGVVTLDTTTNSADLTLDLINRGQFITHACELRKLPPSAALE